MKVLLSCILLLAVTSAVQFPNNGVEFSKCYQKSEEKFTPIIKNPIKKLTHSELPEQWLWNDVDGTNFLTVNRNQHIPVYCGSCWAFATTSAVSDRIKIMRNAQWPDVNLAPQVLLSCDKKDLGCFGGDNKVAYQYMYNYGISDETCSSYEALGWTNGLDCSEEQICKNCMPGKGCWAQQTFNKYYVEEIGAIPALDEEAMANEIFQRGPITCGIAVTSALMNYKGGIFEDTTGATDLDHAVSIVGYGVEDGTPYWLVRNSWGEYWGENGFFKLIRGKNNLGVAQECDFAVPEDTWSKQEQEQKEQSKESEQKYGKSTYTLRQDDTCSVKSASLYETHVVSPLPQDYISDDELPQAWDWRDIDGVNYMSWSVNQHIPVYCGSCWAQAAASAIADRVNIKRKNAWPQAAYAVQTIINCKAGGSCNGGNSLGVYSFAKKEGIPTVTCQQYIAENPEEFSCSDIQKCMDCTGLPSPLSICRAVDEYPFVQVSEYGSVSGVENMKKEIYVRGPISCGIAATDELENDYTGGIFSQKLPLAPLLINHEISVVGWGVENGVDFWVVRNSWGTYWGEQGYFRIQMYEDNLGINTSCSWADPIADLSN